jgi:hypothetical protein
MIAAYIEMNYQSQKRIGMLVTLAYKAYYAGGDDCAVK